VSAGFRHACWDVATFGETMAALRATGPIRLGSPMELSIAGAESNVAIGLARLGHAVRWVGRVGDDEFGALVLRTLRAEGVDTECARVDPDGRPTGLIVFENRVGDLTRVTYRRAGSAGSAIGPEDVGHALDGHDGHVRVLHLTGITPALSRSAAQAALAAVAAAREAGTVVCLDVNHRARLWPADAARTALLPLARMTDILIASADELALVCDDPGLDEPEAVAALLAAGRREVVITRGGDGAGAATAEGTVSLPARPMPVVDVVGAGDAFVAGYLSGFLDGLDVPGRLHRAVTTGAFAVAGRGDWEGLPTREELGLLDGPPGTTLR